MGSYSGSYKLENPLKYIGKGAEPIYKSHYELVMFRWLDTNIKVKRWGYELIEIPYFFPIDSKVHKYQVDIYAEIIDTEGNVSRFLAEIKPNAETKLPAYPSSKNSSAIRSYNLKKVTFIKNQAKWLAASQFCEQAGMKFKIFTETDLY